MLTYNSEYLKKIDQLIHLNNALIKSIITLYCNYGHLSRLLMLLMSLFYILLSDE